MTAVEVEILEPEAAPAARPQLLTMLAVLVQLFRRERAELRWEVGYWRSMHKRARQRESRLKAEAGPLRAQVRRLEGEAEALQARVRELESERFGYKSERCQAVVDCSGSANPRPARRPRGQQKGACGHGRTPLEQLPVQEEVIDLREGEKACPGCGMPFEPFPGCEESEVVEIEVQAYRRRIRRPRYRPRCRCGRAAGIVSAPAPGRLIPRGKLGVSVWAEVLLDKFLHQRPTHRLLQDWASRGLGLSPGTVAGGLQRLLPLFEPLCRAIRERQLGEGLWNGDETRWRVLGSPAGQGWHLWVFCSESAACYLVRPSRAAQVAAGHLGEARGRLVCDRFSAYKKLARESGGRIRLAHCWAHVRRDFLKAAAARPKLQAWADAWVERIGRLYRLNRERVQACGRPGRKGFGPLDRRLRQALQGIRREAARQLAGPALPQAGAKVLRSLQNHWATLTAFAKHPVIPMDNNAAERALRGPVVGRKNFYGSGCEASARLAGALFTVLQTVQRCGLNPRSWLGAYLQACARLGGKPPADLSPFLPWQMNGQRLAELRRPPPGRPPPAAAEEP